MIPRRYRGAGRRRVEQPPQGQQHGSGTVIARARRALRQQRLQRHHLRLVEWRPILDVEDADVPAAERAAVDRGDVQHAEVVVPLVAPDELEQAIHPLWTALENLQEGAAEVHQQPGDLEPAVVLAGLVGQELQLRTGEWTGGPADVHRLAQRRQLQRIRHAS